MAASTIRVRGLLRRAARRLRPALRWAVTALPLGPELRFARHAFDAAWYLRAYPDVAASGRDPLKHYLAYGLFEGRAPNESWWRDRELARLAFDANYYLNRYPDVAASGADPVLHYLEHGRPEGRLPSRAQAMSKAWVDTYGAG